MFSYRRPISVEIRGLRFDTGTRRFNANLVSIADNQVISAKAVTGRFDALIEVPVLKRSIRAGEVIKYEDIELRDYAKARARDDTATDMAALIGKTPQRIITAGRPIRLHELQQEAVIKKNDMVKMTFSQGAMEISTTGQAVEDGVQGSVIGVRNLTSKKIVQGTVHDANTVVISGGNETRISSLGAGGIYEN
ncbi:MAG: flagellar basal body P-ring formation chaperone FlgA [Alphaproteobacteria bacterium]|nr:flagellar basal body P-ring formation chaperone FlgA [Alphaproteobacteria bacterium]